MAADHFGNSQEIVHWDHIADLGQVHALDTQETIN